MKLPNTSAVLPAISFPKNHYNPPPMNLRTALTAILATLFCCAVHAQQRTGFAYYDLDRLYDTIPSLFYDDADYTPE